MQLRRPSGALFASIIVHVVVAAIFAQALLLSHPLLDLFGREKQHQQTPSERLSYVILRNGVPQVGVRPNPNRGATPRPAPPKVLPRLTAPSQIPTTVPVTPRKARPVDTLAGPLNTGRGNLKGVQPRYTDPRLWSNPGVVASEPPGPPGPVAPPRDKTPAERLDSVITDILRAHNDSVRVATGNRREPGDWTVTHNGQKFGIDQKFIHIGPVSIPTAILALLPLNVTGNPSAIERERRSSEIHSDIMAQAQRRINDADVDKAIKAIRERKDRERREKAEREKAASGTGAEGETPPTGN